MFKNVVKPFLCAAAGHEHEQGDSLLDGRVDMETCFEDFDARLECFLLDGSPDHLLRLFLRLVTFDHT